MIVPASVTGSKVEDAAPSRRRLRSVGTLETVVVGYGAGIWPEADSGLFSADALDLSGALDSGPAESPVCLRIGLFKPRSSGRTRTRLMLQMLL